MTEFIDPDNEANDFLMVEDPKPYLNVSGQPNARYEWAGKQNRGYLTKLPETGDFRRYKNGKPKGITRVTTFVKTASDSIALSDWGKRNVLIGAVRRQDVVRRAVGMTHEESRVELDRLVAELETAAGAKVSADIGTTIHELTERVDGGQLTLDDVDEGYRDDVARYLEALDKHGLRPVPGLIERTTMASEFGGVVGTFDRVYLHEPSGQYLIGDVKTGKTLKYGMREIEAQEALYARGLNANGVYDWNRDEWDIPWENDETDSEERRRTRVSEDWGVIIHMPVQGPDADTVQVVKADLQRGWRWAEVCHTVKTERTAPKPELFTDDLFATKGERDWVAAFSDVESGEEASRLWREAKAAGVERMELQRLVGIARQVLRGLGS